MNIFCKSLTLSLCCLSSLPLFAREDGGIDVDGKIGLLQRSAERAAIEKSELEAAKKQQLAAAEANYAAKLATLPALYKKAKPLAPNKNSVESLNERVEIANTYAEILASLKVLKAANQKNVNFVRAEEDANFGYVDALVTVALVMKDQAAFSSPELVKLLAYLNISDADRTKQSAALLAIIQTHFTSHTYTTVEMSQLNEVARLIRILKQ